MQLTIKLDIPDAELDKLVGDINSRPHIREREFRKNFVADVTEALMSTLNKPDLCPSATCEILLF